MDNDDGRGDTAWIATLFLIAALAVSIPAAVLVGAYTTTFTSSVTVASQPPTIVVDGGQSLTGAIAGSAVAYVYFNASSPNGYGNLNDTTATVVLNKTGESSRTSSSCAALSHPNSTTTRYNCSVTIWYFDASNTWSINASIKDNASQYVESTTTTLTLLSLDAISLTSGSISFSGNPGQTAVAASPNPERINNTGNTNYGTINITGFNFANGGNIISVGNVSMTSNCGRSGASPPWGGSAV